MWQRISRSSSCRSTIQHNQIPDSSLRRKQLLNKIHSSNYAPSSEHDTHPARASSSIYCLVNKPLTSLPLDAIVQQRSARESSHFPSTFACDVNPSESDPPHVEGPAHRQALDSSAHTEESRLATSESSSSELTTSSSSPCVLLKVSAKVVSRGLVSRLSRAETSNPPRHFSCYASSLPQFRSVLALSEGKPPGDGHSCKSYWDSDSWRKILGKVQSTGTNDDALRHLQNSEYVASIRKVCENGPFPPRASNRSPSAGTLGETVAYLEPEPECNENVQSELETFTKTHMSALTTTASSVDYDFDERWNVQPRKPDNLDRLTTAGRKFEQVCVCSETELTRLSSQLVVPVEASRHIEQLNAKLTQLIRYRESAVSESDQRVSDRKKTDGKSASAPREDGNFVAGISASTHASVVGWMGKVIESMRWPLSTYFTAIHAMDYTLWKDYASQKCLLRDTVPAEHRKILPDGLIPQTKRPAPLVEFAVPLLSTACVLIGVSGECEHRQLSKARCFVGQVPHVTNVRDIICKELSVVAGLSHGSLIHKTAPDFCLYYISRFECFDGHLSETEGTCGSLYKLFRESFFNFADDDQGCAASLNEISGPQKSSTGGSGRKKGYSSLEPSPSLLSYLLTPRYSHEPSAESLLPSESNVLSVLIEVSLVVSAALTMNSMHSHIPTSRIIATVMFHICTLVAAGLACGRVCSEFCKVAFLLDYDRDMKVLIPTVFLAYEYCIEAFREPSATARHIGFNKCTKSAFLLLKALQAGKESHKFPRC